MIKHMKEMRTGPENPEAKEKKKGMSAQELLDELKKWKEKGVKKVQLIFESGPSEDPVSLEFLNIDEIDKAEGEILHCKIKGTAVEANFDASIVIGIKEWIGKSGQANDIYGNKIIEEVENEINNNRTISDKKFSEYKEATDIITGNAKRKGIGSNDIELNKKLWEANQDNVAS